MPCVNQAFNGSRLAQIGYIQAAGSRILFSEMSNRGGANRLGSDGRPCGAYIRST